MIFSNTQLNISVSASDFASASVGVFPQVSFSLRLFFPIGLTL